MQFEPFFDESLLVFSLVFFFVFCFFKYLLSLLIVESNTTCLYSGNVNRKVLYVCFEKLILLKFYFSLTAVA